MLNKDDVLEKLKQITEPQMTEQQLADRLSIHRVSWLRIKSGRAPLSDIFMLRVDRAFPEWGVFLPVNATNSGEVATQTIPQPHHNKILGRLVS